MSPNFFKNYTVLIALITLGLSLISFPAFVVSEEFTDIRATKQFKKALKAQRLGRLKEAKNLVAEFPKHPLYGYVIYHDLKRRLNLKNSKEIDLFLKNEGSSRVGKLLRKRWLKKLHRNRRWKDFLDYYEKSSFPEPEMLCRFYEAKIKRNEGTSIIGEIKSTWNQGSSLPKECDPAFAFLYNSGSLNDQLVWDRIKKAYNKNNPSLAKYLTRFISDKKLIKLQRNWDYARRSPQRFFKRQNLPDSQEARDILVHGIKRLSRFSLEKSIQEWGKISAEYSFNKQQLSQIFASLGAAGARLQDERGLEFLEGIDDDLISQSAERNRLAMGIYFKAWPKIIKWTNEPTQNDISNSRLEFWRAYALGEVGRKIESVELLKAIAKRRNYHAFLAADMLGTKYQFNHQSLKVSKEQINNTLKASNYSRADELFKIGKKLEAKREFFHELTRSTEHQLEIAAKLAEIWDWPKGSIFALGKASSFDDLELRFPLRYVKEIERQLTPNERYVVKKGDSLWKISNRLGVTIAKLRKWNNLRKSTVLHPGQRLVVNKASESKIRNNRQFLYRVKNGDSLWKISRNLNVSIRDLQQWNNLDSESILRVGTRLKIGSKSKKEKNLSLTRTLAIVRAESAFDPFARSPANARGLMQVIPPTARLTARKHGVRLGRIRNLYQPRVNIRIGTAYLSDLLDQFDGNFAMAAAAYNAGPHRAKRWQKKRCGDPRMWIDSIPITETRRYVRRAIFYSKVYEWRLGRPVKRISKEIGLIPHHSNKSKKKECWL